MLRTRKRRWIALAILTPLLMLAIAIWLVYRTSEKRHLAFESLRIEMTVDEASEALGMALRNQLWTPIGSSGANWDGICNYSNTIGIFEIERYELYFESGKLSDKESARPTAQEFWDTTIYNAEKLLGINRGSSRRLDWIVSKRRGKGFSIDKSRP